ncbi:sister chromatid cohesion factor [Grosmannia clavigera kw1407]|uniref:Sister chromatid cohesion factor n=1 Tax=Grosmannia clavigera (strain kw1407 / UAMH 11150) TaxID=655863 RepID=F0X8I3_GROCL|nr:sister chromatid cohesion factor [Grosmannia clavigera kw1407]EFX05610.1 sister chromatid cohesion factor [Grosmannia clavigera kw1407]
MLATAPQPAGGFSLGASSVPAMDTATGQRKRAVGGFVDDDSDSEEEGSGQEKGVEGILPPPAKKRMLEHESSSELHQEPGESGIASLLGGPAAESELAPTTTDILDTANILDDRSIPDAQVVLEESHEQLGEEDRYDLLFRSGPGDMLLEPEAPRRFRVQTCSGKSIPMRERRVQKVVPYEAMVAARSRTKEGRAKRSFYGIDIHELIDGAQKEIGEKKDRERREQEQARAQSPDAMSTRPSTALPIHSVGRQMDGDGSKKSKKKRSTMLWTEKYRARSFMDLVGDDLTNRLVLKWLKRWDAVVFPHAAKGRRRPGNSVHSSSGSGALDGQQQQAGNEERAHRKILILTGPPGLGKTTLAHVCARQAGYDVLEINASDDRSRDVVNGRIRTSLGTESVKTIEHVTSRPVTKAKAAGAGTGGFSLLAASTAAVERTGPAKVARPVCVIVDEVDGAVGGSGATGEGGFVKALMDLVLVDQRNSGSATAATTGNKRKKDDFRQKRPLILICNDVYHPALRPLRQSGLAEVVHVGKPSAETVVVRLKSIFEKEGITCEKEAARKLCEAAWGMGADGQESRRGTESTAEGDLRGVMVVGEWVARRLRAMTDSARPQLTRQWVNQNVMADMAHGSGGGGGVGARGLGRGGVREIVSRVFQEGGGFPKTGGGSGWTCQQRLREMVETSGDVDRIMTEVFAEYPNREFNDDLYLSKPDSAYEWLHFHDLCSRRVFGSQEWELMAYTSQPVLACHELFATSRRHMPAGEGADGGSSTASVFSGPRADFAAREAEKQSRAALQAIQAQLPPSLLRALRSAEDVAVDFLPYLVRLVSPDVKPVLVNVSSGSGSGSGNGGGGGVKNGMTSVASVRREGERVLVRRAAEVLAELGISLRRGMLEEETVMTNPSVAARPQWVYRMEPDIDSLAAFETAGTLLLPSGSMPTRYAVRQVLDQELRRTLAQREMQARQARFQAGRPAGESQTMAAVATVKKSLPDTAAADGVAVKRDFFGRIVVMAASNASRSSETNGRDNDGGHVTKAGGRVWVTFHEGLNNAVRKPITVEEFVRGL